MKKNKINNRITAAALAVLMVCTFMLAACGTGSDKGTKTQALTGNAGGNDNITDDYTVKVAVLGGPTGMGMAKLWSDSNDGKTAVKYNFSVTASPDAAYLTDIKKGQFDIAALPTNVAAKLYNSGAPLKIAAVNTLGVLYMLEVADTPTIQSVADLKGKTIYTTGEGATPEYALRYILRGNGLDPDKDVTIIYETDGPTVVADIKKGSASVVMLPEPMATSVRNSTGAKTVLDITKEWDKVAGVEGTLAQGCIVVSDTFAVEHAALLKAFLEEYSESVGYVNEHTEEAAGMIYSLGIVTVSKEVAMAAIPGSKITYSDGEEMKAALGKLYAVLFASDTSSIGGRIPDDNIIYFAK